LDLRVYRIGKVLLWQTDLRHDLLFHVGLLGIGWFMDLFLILSIASEADLRFKEEKIR
jgi:hypothetical protein